MRASWQVLSNSACDIRHQYRAHLVGMQNTTTIGRMQQMKPLPRWTTARPPYIQYINLLKIAKKQNSRLSNINIRHYSIQFSRHERPCRQITTQQHCACPNFLQSAPPINQLSASLYIAAAPTNHDSLCTWSPRVMTKWSLVSFQTASLARVWLDNDWSEVFARQKTRQTRPLNPILQIFLTLTWSKHDITVMS